MHTRTLFWPRVATIFPLNQSVIYLKIHRVAGLQAAGLRGARANTCAKGKCQWRMAMPVAVPLRRHDNKAAQ